MSPPAVKAPPVIRLSPQVEAVLASLPLRRQQLLRESLHQKLEKLSRLNLLRHWTSAEEAEQLFTLRMGNHELCYSIDPKAGVVTAEDLRKL